MSLLQKCQAVRLLLSDVDGVMTEGGVTYDARGSEIKTFHIRDGLGIRLWQQAGGKFGIVTGRESPIVAQRAEELGITIVRQAVPDKLAIVQQIAAAEGMTLAEVAYLGDDLPDLRTIRSVGLGVAVADGAAEVRQAAAYITTVPGGRGAVREVVELVLKNQDRWNQLVDHVR